MSENVNEERRATFTLSLRAVPGGGAVAIIVYPLRNQWLHLLLSAYITKTHIRDSLNTDNFSKIYEAIPSFPGIICGVTAFVRPTLLGTLGLSRPTTPCPRRRPSRLCQWTTAGFGNRHIRTRCYKTVRRSPKKASNRKPRMQRPCLLRSGCSPIGWRR